MKARHANWLIPLGALSAACSALIGDDFNGYELSCLAKTGPSCVAGNAGTSSALGVPEGGASAGMAGADDDFGNAGAGQAGEAGTHHRGSAGSANGDGGTGQTGDDGGAGGTKEPPPTGGSAGAGGSAGKSTADTAGTGSTGGTAGPAGPLNPSVDCQPDAIIVPECTLYGAPGGNYPPVNVSAVNGVAIWSSELFGGGFNVFGTKRGVSTIVARYTRTVGPDAEWTNWYCMDALPKPARMAAGRLVNGRTEVFVTSSCGTLYRRAEIPDGSWLAPWASFTLPTAGAVVTDVSMSVDKDGVNIVYIADAGRIFLRHRASTEPYSLYGSWQEIPAAPAAVLVTAGLRPDHRQQVFVLDAQGALYSAVQDDTNLDSAFGPWEAFDMSELPSPLVDIEVPSGTSLELFATAANGTLWQRADSAAWRAWDGPALLAPLFTLAGAALIDASGAPLVLVGSSISGGVYTIRRHQNAWREWTQLP